MSLANKSSNQHWRFPFLFLLDISKGTGVVLHMQHDMHDMLFPYFIAAVVCWFRRVYEEELLLTELAIARVVQNIIQEQTEEAAQAVLQDRLASSTGVLQQLQQELQKQQCSCWVLDDERASAQQNQREKAAALTAALGTGHISSELLTTLTKKLNDV